MGCASSGQSGTVHSDTPGGDIGNGLMAKVGAKGEAIMEKAKGLVDTEIAQPISNMADDAMKKVHEVGEVVEDKIESLFCSADEKKQEMQNGLEAITENIKPDTPIDDIEKNIKDEMTEMLESVESTMEETIGEEGEKKEEEKKEEEGTPKTDP